MRSKIFLFLFILASYIIQPVYGVDAIYTDTTPNIDGVLSTTEWSEAIEERETLHFEWRVNATIGGEFYVNSSWFSLWDDSAIYLAFTYERRPGVELVDEIIVLIFDENNNQEIDDGEFCFAAQLEEEGARSRGKHSGTMGRAGGQAVCDGSDRFGSSGKCSDLRRITQEGSRGYEKAVPACQAGRIEARVSRGDR